MDNTYHAVKERAFASGNVPDGYFGARQDVLFSLTENIIVAVTPYGYFNTGYPTVMNEEEAFWILKNHPHTRAWDVQNINIIEGTGHPMHGLANFVRFHGPYKTHHRYSMQFWPDGLTGMAKWARITRQNAALRRMGKMDKHNNMR